MTVLGTAPRVSRKEVLPAHHIGTSASRGVVPTLWHFTCDHGAPGIVAIGALMPNQHPSFPRLLPVVWLTDDPSPLRDEVGLTSTSLPCDRMSHRFRVTDTSQCYPWRRVVDAIWCDPAQADALPRHLVADLERYGRPDSWWVSMTPVPAVFT